MRFALAALLVLSAAFTPRAGAVDQIVVPAGDVAALTAAIQTVNANPTSQPLIFLSGTYTLTASLPPISGSAIFLGGTIRASGTSFRAVTVNSGVVEFSTTTFENFNAAGDGGAILANGGTLILSGGATLSNNTASGNGGAVAVKGNAALNVRGATFTGNQAGGAGGALSLESTRETRIEKTRFGSNCATQAGGVLAVNGAGGATLRNNNIGGSACTREIVEAPFGKLVFIHNTIVAGNTAQNVIHSTAQPTQLHGNVLSGNAIPQQTSKIVCSDFGSGAIASLGANIVRDTSCTLNQPGDMPNADPRLTGPDANGIYGLAANSPAIERGRSALLNTTAGTLAPCGHADVRGLGRPQDNDNDGQYECDSGAYEVQAGADLVPGHTMTVFDPARSGEGSTIEILDGGVATVSTFTFGANGGAAWFVGAGRVVGNTVVVDDMQDATGGVFGSGFNPQNIVRRHVGGTSFVFADCDASARPGNYTFAASPGGGYSDITAKAQRLSTVVTCNGAIGPRASRSGAFADPNRSGEGVIVQHLTDGRVVLVYYGFTPGGQQMWLISGAATVTGDTITAQMVYPAGTTRFGTAFNPANVRLDSWGTFTLTYTGCNQLRIDYTSTVAGYGSGAFNLSRLTRPRGIACT